MHSIRAKPRSRPSSPLQMTAKLRTPAPRTRRLPPATSGIAWWRSQKTRALLSKLFPYRFKEGRGLKGHSFGNLFLSALTHITGDFAQAVKISSEVLASVGRIYPCTSSNVTLELNSKTGVS